MCLVFGSGYWGAEGGVQAAAWVEDEGGGGGGGGGGGVWAADGGARSLLCFARFVGVGWVRRRTEQKGGGAVWSEE